LAGRGAIAGDSVTGKNFNSGVVIGIFFSTAMAIVDEVREKMTSNKINILSNIR
jgi:hypothetical protein